MFSVFPVSCYRVGKLQSTVAECQELIIQAWFQADDVINDCLFYLNTPVTEQLGSVSDNRTAFKS